MKNLMSLTLWIGVGAQMVLCSHQVLCGRTGTGKSYIASASGCVSQTSSGTKSCTKEVKVCPNGIIDTVGLDDDGKEYIVEYEGNHVSLSGLTFPVYSLLEKLERDKISDVEFFFVVDANNMKYGNSADFFLDFLKTDLKCTYTRVINKYRDIKSHRDNVLPSDLLIHEDADKINLEGPNCVFGLNPNWRNKVFASDLTAVRSQMDIDNCNKLKTRKIQFDEVMAKRAEEAVLSDCTENIEVGRYETQGWSVSTPFGSVSGGGNSHPIFQKGSNKECARKDSAHIAAVNARNQQLHEEKQSLAPLIASIDAGLSECVRLLPSNMRFEL